MEDRVLGRYFGTSALECRCVRWGKVYRPVEVTLLLEYLGDSSHTWLVQYLELKNKTEIESQYHHHELVPGSRYSIALACYSGSTNAIWSMYDFYGLINIHL